MAKTKKLEIALPSGEKDTPQLRERLKNYIKEQERLNNFGPGDKENNYQLIRDNSFYEFNKPQYDSKKSKKTKGKKRKIEFNVGDKFNTHGHSNMVGVVTLRKIEGRKIFFTDSEKTDYQGFDASTARKLIEAKEWTKVDGEKGKLKSNYNYGFSTEKEYKDAWEKAGKPRMISIGDKRYAPHELDRENPELFKKLFGNSRTGSTKLFPLIVVAAILIGISVSGLAIVANSNSNGSTG